MEDWAEKRAREFCNERWPSQRVEADDLAAMLREVATEKEYAQWQYSQHTVAEERDKLLSDVRRIVEEMKTNLPEGWYEEHYARGRAECADDILKRLESL